MFRPVEFFISFRYTRPRSRNHFISFISTSSVLGIMLGVMALIIVLSVMNGFHTEVRDRILGMASHASIRPVTGEMADWQNAVKMASMHPEVVGTAAFVEGQGMLVNRGKVGAAQLRGIFPEQEPAVSEVGEKMLFGSLEDLKPGSFNIVIGRELANILGADIGEKITVVIPQASITPVGTMPRLKRFTLSGIFEVGMGEYDRGVALINVTDAAKLYDLGEGVSGVRIKLRDMFEARRVSRELVDNMGGLYRITDWTQQHRNFFSALETEKRMMAIILLLIVAVAAFNIVSTLVMVVTEKRSDIAILMTLGATARRIMTIFILQGTFIGLVGTLLGVAGGVLVAENLEQIVGAIESAFNVQFIDPSVYYISKLPSELRWSDVNLIAVSAFLLSLLATIYPAWMASRTQPAEALRYE
jgi:lipoprotein-releasing system permease protein